MSKGFNNSKKNSFLAGLGERPSLECDKNDLTLRCKFNFSYFDASQSAGQDFKDWTPEQLRKLLDKLKNYSRFSLDHWHRERIGNSGLTTLAIYGEFPIKRKTNFHEPAHIPHQARWGRFRLEQVVRLIGFMIPPALHKTYHKVTGELFDKNTFYIVFLDKFHKFYNTEKNRRNGKSNEGQTRLLLSMKKNDNFIGKKSKIGDRPRFFHNLIGKEAPNKSIQPRPRIAARFFVRASRRGG